MLRGLWLELGHLGLFEASLALLFHKADFNLIVTLQKGNLLLQTLHKGALFGTTGQFFVFLGQVLEHTFLAVQLALQLLSYLLELFDLVLHL